MLWVEQNEITRPAIRGSWEGNTIMANKLSIICTSGTREKLQMAAMMAATAAVSGSTVSVFLSMNALGYFLKTGVPAAPIEGELGRLMEQKHVPPFTDLFRQAAELGDAKLLPCSMAMDVLGITESQLQPYLEAPVGLTKYLTDCEDSQMVSF